MTTEPYNPCTLVCFACMLVRFVCTKGDDDADEDDDDDGDDADDGDGDDGLTSRHAGTQVRRYAGRQG